MSDPNEHMTRGADGRWRFKNPELQAAWEEMKLSFPGHFDAEDDVSEDGNGAAK